MGVADVVAMSVAAAGVLVVAVAIWGLRRSERVYKFRTRILDNIGAQFDRQITAALAAHEAGSTIEFDRLADYRAAIWASWSTVSYNRCMRGLTIAQHYRGTLLESEGLLPKEVPDAPS